MHANTFEYKQVFNWQHPTFEICIIQNGDMHFIYTNYIFYSIKTKLT